LILWKNSLKNFYSLVNNKIGKNRPDRFYGFAARETGEKHETVFSLSGTKPVRQHRLGLRSWCNLTNSLDITDLGRKTRGIRGQGEIGNDE
jgi:hypothetical protein